MTRARSVPLPGRGVTLEVIEAGEPGARPLLAVHGFTGAKEDFADHLDHLAAGGRTVVAPDLRGHGASDQPAGTDSYGLEVFALDLVALADALGWDRFSVVGHSMGGMVAQHLALGWPERLDGLVLMATGHGPPDGVSPGLVELGRSVVAQGGMELLVEMTRFTAGALETPAHGRVASERPGYIQFNEAKALACAPDMWLALVDEMMAQPDRLDRLASLRVPTLVMVGDQDRAFLDASRRMAAAIPGATLATIAGAGHSPQFECPEAWRAALVGFLDGLPGAAGARAS